MELPNFNLPDFSKFTVPNHFPGTQSMMNSIKQPNMEMREGGLTEVDDLENIDFLKKLYESDLSLFLGNPDKITRVFGDVTIDPTLFKRNSLFLESFEFTGIVNFSGAPDSPIDLGNKIILKNCVFQKPLKFKNCSSWDTSEVDFTQRSAAIEICNGSFKILSLSNCSLPFGVDIYSEEGNNIEIDWFESHHNHFSKAGYTFDGVTFKSKVDITADTIENMGIDFKNCLSDSPIRISSLVSPTLSFTGKTTKINNDLRIWGGKIGSIVWNDGLFENEISIASVAIRKNLSIIGSEFQDKFTFRRKDSDSQVFNHNLPEEIWIQDSKFKNGIEFSGDCFSTDKLTVVFSEKSSGVIDFREIYFSEVNLKGNNFNNSLFLRDCTYDTLSLSHFFNKSLLSFNNNNPDGKKGNPLELRIQNSNLGNTEFYDFDFTIYPAIRIIDSRLDNIFVNGVEWFEPDQLQIDESENDPRKILSQRREIYRQLKLAAEKQSDRIISLKFKAKEIEIHNELLGKENYFSKKWFKQIGDMVAIYLGASNNHGQNWVLPLGLVILITTVPFYPLIFMAADPEISLWCLECDFISLKTFREKFWNYGSSWPSLFNPARRLNDLFPKVEIENSFALGFWDGLHRIILAFFIFQIVSAFRKFVK